MNSNCRVPLRAHVGPERGMPQAPAPIQGLCAMVMCGNLLPELPCLAGTNHVLLRDIENPDCCGE